jgi:large subunit ribosomal protein L30
MANKKKLEVKQVGSPIRRQKVQEQCLKGLGLGKLNRSRVLEDTPSIRGLICKVHHLVDVKEL